MRELGLKNGGQRWGEIRDLIPRERDGVIRSRALREGLDTWYEIGGVRFHTQNVSPKHLYQN